MYLCVCVRAHVRARTLVCMCMYVCIGQMFSGVFPNHKPLGPFRFCFPALGFQIATYTSFHLSAEDSNSGQNAYAVSSFPTKPSPQSPHPAFLHELQNSVFVYFMVQMVKKEFKIQNPDSQVDRLLVFFFCSVDSN